METLEKVSNLEGIEQRRALHSVLLLREAALSQDERLKSQLTEQVYDLETSHIGEVLAGQNRTHFEFESSEGRLYALQPGGITDWLSLHENGRQRARAKAIQNPRFNFYHEIAEVEYEAAEAQQELVKAGEPATIFELSLDGSDVAAPQDLRLLGRDPEKRRAYLRASVFDERLHLYSASSDGMDLKEARKIYRDYFGIELPKDATSIDILRTRVKLSGAQHGLLDKILPPESANTYEFTLQQQDLLKAHLTSLGELATQKSSDSVMAEQANDLRYDIMSSFKQRLEGTWIDKGTLAASVAYAGLLERDAGTQFPGCDTVVTKGRENPLAKTGYLNASSLSKELWVWKDGYCQIKECPTRQPKPKKVKVGPCSVCKNCQSLFDDDKDPVKEYKRHQKKQTKSSSWLW